MKDKNNIIPIIMDISVNPTYTYDDNINLNRCIMQSCGFHYLQISNFETSDFVDNVHFTTAGYTKVMAAINLYLGN